VVKTLFAILVSAFVAALSVGVMVNSIDAAMSAKGLWNSLKHAKRAVKDKFPMKMDLFVNLNGGVMRFIGRRLCNKRLLYKRGMLGMLCYAAEEKEGLRRGRKSVESLAAGLRECNKPFVFVLAPCKLDLGGKIVPEGWHVWNANVGAEQIVPGMRAYGVHMLDLIPLYAATADDVEENFFRTDHHWKIRTAFSASRLVAAEIAAVLKSPEIADHPNLDENSWEWRVLDNGFCGAHGRRTGRIFSGMEDFEYAVPLFPTDIAFEIPCRRISRKGTFEKAEMESYFIEGTHWTTDRYACYTGGNYPLQTHSSSTAPFPYRILLFKDSFGNPVASFLATMFREVIQVDMRRQPKSVSELDVVKRFNPDVVVRLENITSFVKAGYKLQDIR
jgi:hypothetical protein